MHVDERHWTWVYPVTATAALLLALLLPSASARLTVADKRTYAVLQLITLLGAMVGAKLVMLAGDLGWPLHAVSWDHALFSGKSLVGGLLGGFVSAEVAKPFFGWREPPNDWFATKLLLSIAIGRVGCVFGGCCRGIPTTSRLSLIYSDGVPRVPVSALEAVFHALLFASFWLLQRRERFRGRLFALYLLVYGAWRFALEPWRETPKSVAGLSVYQLFALALIAAGAWSFRRALPSPARAQELA